MNNETYNEMVVGDFHDRLFAFMKICGIKSIDVNYSGGGDSGGVDHIDVYFAESSKISLNDRTALNRRIVDKWEEELAQPIWNRHGGFADGGGYSVSGVVTYNAHIKSVAISGTDHHHGDDYYDEEGNEIEEREEKETAIDWEENLLIEKEVEKRESGYDFLCFYANNVLNSPLPEEFHNRVLIAAVEGDLGAKEYIQRLIKVSK
jgi:hypothetical protein